MLSTPRRFALFTALLVSAIITAFLSLVKDISVQAIWIGGIVSLISVFMTVYLLLDFVIFNEINKLYNMIEKVRKKDNKKLKKVKKSWNLIAAPIGNIQQEIVAFAADKEAEIQSLREMEIRRREFFADISHELKTPIFSAQGFIDTLLDGAVEDENVRYIFLQKAAKSLDALNELVQELLLLSQIEAGMIEMDIQQFDVLELIKEVLQQAEDDFKERNVKLKIVSDMEKVPVKADKNRIKQVLVNLIDNALKYGTKEQGSEITVQLETEKKNVNISITDNGIGIPEQDIERIFERFYRVEKSRSKSKGGTGLGLAIVKQIIEAHESKIIVSSKVGEGTSFKFKLKRPKTDND